MAASTGRRTRQRQPDPPEVEYLVKGADGDFAIKVPADWKLTFGYVNPGKPEGGYGGRSAHCLRVYEGEKLRAVYANVQSFRDLSIPLVRKYTKETGGVQWERDDRSFEQTKRIERETAWDAADEEVTF